MKRGNLWFLGVCDELYRKIKLWDAFYWTGGDVHSTRQWLNPLNAQIEPKPTKMAHYIPFREIELDHLIRILEALRPNTPILEEWGKIRKLWKYGKSVQGYVYHKSYWSRVPLPQGIHKVLIIVFYEEHVKELIAILEEARTGQKSAALEAAVEKAKQAGKELLEE
jgi:hypothetical protein